MNIRNKILLSFSASSILLVGIAFFIVYWLFSRYREEEFQQLQNQKINYTIKLVDRFKKESAEISYILDAQDIHDFYDEKLLIFDNNKQLIFSSLDSLDIIKRKDIINELSPTTRWIETKEGDYDLIGVYAELNKISYYAISKAYDAVGYDKLNFLQRILIISYFLIIIIIVFISLYLANNLSKPINRLAFLLGRYNFDEEENKPLENETTTEELQYLTARFNELLQRTSEVFSFQRNTVNHISHQLKTPVSVLVSELEKMQQQDHIDLIKEDLKIQTHRAKSLGDIISILLEIAKIESGKNLHKQVIRLDEMVFDLIDHFKLLYPDFTFNLHFKPELFTENQMQVNGNELLLKQSLENLFHNSIIYSTNTEAVVTIDTSQNEEIKVIVINDGKVISHDEQKFLFHYFFRGENSVGKSGNGLGLVLAQKIAHLHAGSISYSILDNKNIFSLTLPTQKPDLS